MGKLRSVVLGIITVLCVGVLVYFLFFFNGDTKNIAPSVTTATLREYTILFDTDELHYSAGKSLMDGVTATDSDGRDVTKFVTVSCKPTKKITEKEMTYSINKQGYDIIPFTRKLIVDGKYNGPKIKVNDSDISVPINEISSLSAIVIRSGAISADDGFGNPCSISARISNEEIKVGDYVATVEAENILGDKKSVKITVTVTPATTSVIKLTATSITLNKGEKFVPEKYIRSAEYKPMGDIRTAVKCNHNVDTSHTGNYTAVYYIYGIDELKDERTTLNVTVK